MSSSEFNISTDTDFNKYFQDILNKCDTKGELIFTITTTNNEDIPIKYISETLVATSVLRNFQGINDPTINITITPNPSKVKKLKEKYSKITFNNCPQSKIEDIQEQKEEQIEELEFKSIIQQPTTQITELTGRPIIQPIEEEPIAQPITIIKDDIKDDEYINPINVSPSQSNEEDTFIEAEDIGTFQFRDIEVWQKEFNDKDSIDTISLSLGSYYSDRDINKDAYTIQLNSSSFLDLIKKYRDTDINNNPIRAFKKSNSNYSPYLELAKQNRYDAIPIYPIVLNTPEHYKLDEYLLSKKINRHINYSTEENNINFNDIKQDIENHVKLYKSFAKNNLTYKQYYNILTNGGSFPFEDDTITVKPFYNS